MIKFFTILAFSIMGSVYASTININVTDKGFEPSNIKVSTKENVILAITRKTDETCATEISIPSRKIRKLLPLNKLVTIDLGKLKKGDLNFSCGMDMTSGVINVQ